jgi:hypothetical protein
LKGGRGGKWKKRMKKGKGGKLKEEKRRMEKGKGCE